jgi:hypothetical protein
MDNLLSHLPLRTLARQRDSNGDLSSLNVVTAGQGQGQGESDLESGQLLGVGGASRRRLVHSSSSESLSSLSAHAAGRERADSTSSVTSTAATLEHQSEVQYSEHMYA